MREGRNVRVEIRVEMRRTPFEFGNDVGADIPGMVIRSKIVLNKSRMRYNRLALIVVVPSTDIYIF